MTTMPARSRLRAIAGFLSDFEAPGFVFGDHANQDPTVIVLDDYMLSERAQAFVDTAYQHGWVVEDFDWMTWKDTPEAARLRDDPAVLAQATPEQLGHLLTTIIRQERYVTGSIGSHFTSGLLIGILRRAAALGDEGPTGGNE